MTLYLADNSALRLMWENPDVLQRLESLAEQGHLLAWCMPSRDEILYSARSMNQVDNLLKRLDGAFVFLPLRARAEEIALHIRTQLWQADHGRAAGLTPILIAAIAIDHGATVLHENDDYEAIAAVEPRVRQQRVFADRVPE